MFCDHIVICGWNRRGKKLVSALKALNKRPIVVVNVDPNIVLNCINGCHDVYFVPGDASRTEVLLSADVGNAHSVIVLADYSLGMKADARSVEIALAVERMQSSVYTVVEVVDIRNKAHFSWTKVDDIVSEQEIAVCLSAQSIRHIVSIPAVEKFDSEEFLHEEQLLQAYGQLLNPSTNEAQLFRVELSWEKMRELRFHDILAKSLARQVLPVALVGYKRHEIRNVHSTDNKLWQSWKTEHLSNPPANLQAKEIWPVWPSNDHTLGLIVIASGQVHANSLKQVFA